MKSTGVVRRVDDLGRVVLPIELRRTMHIADGEDFVEVFVDGNTVILRKYDPSCVFCNSMEDLFTYNNEYLLCSQCTEKIAKLGKKSKW